MLCHLSLFGFKPDKLQALDAWLQQMGIPATWQYTKTAELGPRHLEQKTNRECSSHVPEPRAKQPRNYATNSIQKQVCSRHGIVCITASLKETRNTWKLEQTNTVPTRYQHGTNTVPKSAQTNGKRQFQERRVGWPAKRSKVAPIAKPDRCALQNILRQYQEVAALPWRKFPNKNKPTWEIKGL